MRDDDVMLLQDPNFLMVLLAAIIKKAGGSTSICLKDVEGITNDEALGLFRDLEDEETFVLKIVSREEYKDHLGKNTYYSNTEAKKDTGGS